MRISSFPDILRYGRLSAASADIRRQAAAAEQEVASGRLNRADTVRNLNGRLGDAHLVQREINLLERRETPMALALTRAATMQSSLDAVMESIDTIPEDARAAVGRNDDAFLATTSQSAKFALDTVVTALNAQAGRRYLFSGDTVDRSPLPDAAQLIEDIRTILIDADDAAAANVALDDYFGVAGGFETTIYQGGAGPAGGVEIAEGDVVTLEPRADAQAFRDVIRGLAVTSLIDEAGFPPEERDVLIDTAAGAMTRGVEATADLVAVTGLVETRLENAQARNAAQSAVLVESYNAMTGADPFEAATRLEQLDLQLQATYAITARLSQLNFTNFIR